MLSVVQLIQVHRHPKFNFLVKTEKEIFGKIKILKVDETLSFGVVVTEKEKGAIKKNSKIASLDFVTYGGTESLSLNPTPEEELANRDDSKIAFGKNARAWSPEHHCPKASGKQCSHKIYRATHRASRPVGPRHKIRSKCRAAQGAAAR